MTTAVARNRKETVVTKTETTKTPSEVFEELVAESEGRFGHKKGCPAKRAETFDVREVVHVVHKDRQKARPGDLMETTRCLDCGRQVTRSLDDPSRDPIYG